MTAIGTPISQEQAVTAVLRLIHSEIVGEMDDVEFRSAFE